MTNLSFQIKPLLFLFSYVLLCFVQKYVIFNISKTKRKPLSRIKPLLFYIFRKKKKNKGLEGEKMRNYKQDEGFITNKGPGGRWSGGPETNSKKLIFHGAVKGKAI